VQAQVQLQARKRVLLRRRRAWPQPLARQPQAKTIPALKAPARQAPARRVPAKQAQARQMAAKQAQAQQVPVQQVPARQVPVLQVVPRQLRRPLPPPWPSWQLPSWPTPRTCCKVTSAGRQREEG